MKTKYYLNQSVVSLLMLLLCSSVQAQTNVELGFETVVASYEEAPLERLYDGAVEAVNQATISAQTAGRIEGLYYDVDDFVEAGSVIVRFTDVEQQAALEQAQAALVGAQAGQVQTMGEYRRTSGLFNTGSGSKREYDHAVATRDAANAQVIATQSAVKAAEQQLEYTLIRAPYAGIVTERFVEISEAVTIGQPLMSGLSLESLRVVVDLPQSIAAKVRKIKKAIVHTKEGFVTPTKLTIFPFADKATNTFKVRIELPERQYSLYPGMFVKVAFVVGESKRLLIPELAVIRRSELTGVYVVGQDKVVRLRQIRVGNRFDERIEVLSGLNKNEVVALDPVAAGIHIKSLTGDKQ